MTYENPEIPEGINSGNRRPLRDLAILGGGTAALGLVAVVALTLLGSVLGPLVPYSWERGLAGGVSEEIMGEEVTASPRLQTLVDDLARAQGLPADMEITALVIEDDQVMAFATLGGYLFVSRGLLEAVPNENALAWVLGHEIAHIANRDVMRAMGGGMLVTLAFAAVFGETGLIDQVVLGGGGLAALHFGRERESQADRDGLRAVVAHYGHATGYADAVEALRVATRGMDEPLPLLASHPALDDRMAALDDLVREEGWATDMVRPLDPAQW